MKLNLVDDIDKVKEKGDAYPIYNSRLHQWQLVICCPGCGEVSGPAGKHRWIPETQSYHPSIVHSETLGGCGWHGWLKNGVFTNC